MFPEDCLWFHRYVPRDERPEIVEVFVDDRIHKGEQVRFRKRPQSLAELRASVREEKYLMENDGGAYEPSGGSGSPNGSIFDRLTDTSEYTGAHKLRFDARGKGRGKRGRQDEGEANRLAMELGGSSGARM